MRINKLVIYFLISMLITPFTFGNSSNESIELCFMASSSSHQPKENQERLPFKLNIKKQNKNHLVIQVTSSKMDDYSQFLNCSVQGTSYPCYGDDDSAKVLVESAFSWIEISHLFLGEPGKPPLIVTPGNYPLGKCR